MWFVLALLVAASIAITLVGWFGWQGKLPRQGFAGIRTRYSMANDEQWHAVHRAGAPYLIFGGVGGLAAGLALLPFAIAGELSDGFVTSAVIALGLLIAVSALTSAILGVRGAKASLAR